MALETGARVGIYEVTGKLGEGGMGEVYRAHDTTLDRDVALKVLSEGFTADPDRLSRFQREAKVLASLNHPNIGGIYGLESAGDSQALVLELIEGPTLADRIAEGPIQVDEAIAIAKQMADALEAAHEEGIVHRDLKPANVKVRPDGTVKVLDFGLAKAVNPEGGDGSGADTPTISLTGATQMGMVVGTAAYMAPEQAKGKPVDKRADIWAFGVVLLEMLGGKRVFEGETASETLAAVMMKDPSWELVPEDLPASLDNLLHRCLQKDPRKRVRDIGDVRLAMEGAFETTVVAPMVEAPASTLQIWQQPIPASIALVIAVVGSVLIGGMFLRGVPAVPNIARFIISAPEGEQFMIALDSADLAISPDGQKVAYLTGLSADINGPKSLLLRSLDDFETVRLAENGALYYPFFSPDGEWVGFYDLNASELKRVSVTGGSALNVVSLPAPLRGASWGDDDSIVYASQEVNSGLWRVSANGGVPEQLTTPDPEQGETNHSWPQMLPGSKHVLYTALASPADDSLIVVLSLESGEQRVVARGGFYGRYVSTGHLLYAVGNSVRAIAFDPDQLEVSGSPVPVVEDVVTKTLGAANFSVADNGSLAYVPGTTALRDVTRQLVWVDREGRETILDAVPAPYESPRISPDGRYVAVQTVGDNPDVVVYDLERNTTTRLTFDSGYDGNPTWSPDGEDILFNSNRTGQGNIFRKPADGTGQVEQLTDYDVPVFLDQMTPDGDNVLMSINRGNFDLQLMPLQDLPAETSQALVATEFNEGVSAISPDGQWIAYQSNESGEFEVYVRPFPNVDDGRWQISQNGGVGPLWGPTGEELFYQQAGSAVIMSVDVDTESSFRPGNPEILFSGDYRPYSPNSGRSFDLSPDGRRFLLLTDDQNGTIAGETGRIVLVQNWFEELKERVPVP